MVDFYYVLVTFQIIAFVSGPLCEKEITVVDVFYHKTMLTANVANKQRVY